MNAAHAQAVSTIEALENSGITVTVDGQSFVAQEFIPKPIKTGCPIGEIEEADDKCCKYFVSFEILLFW